MTMLPAPTRTFAAALLTASVLLTACASEPAPEPTPEAQPAITADMSESLLALDIPNMTQPTDDLLCAGQLSPDQMDALQSMGFASFISLRQATEKGAGWEEEHAMSTSANFQRLPVAGAAGIDEATSRTLATVLETTAKPVVLYCGSSNRVGALLALKAFHVDNQPPEAALTFGKSAGLTKLEPLAREKLGL